MPNDAKVYGASLPQNPAPDERVGFFICIPNALEYRAAMRGAMDKFSKWFYWEHTSQAFADIPEANLLAAQVWGNALQTMQFYEDCEMPMSCEEIINCIENNPATQAALFDYLTQSEAFKRFVQGQGTTPVLPPTTTGKNILKPGQCNPDYLFSQVTELVSLLNRVSVDMFEAIEVLTNRVERANLIVSAIPAFGSVVPIDEILGGIDTFVGAFQEDYDAAWTTTLEDTIRCDLFCEIKDACDLTLSGVIAFYEQRVPQQFPTDPLAIIGAIWEFIYDGATPGDASVYGMHLFVLALMRAASSVFGTDFAQLMIRVQGAGDTPNNDWLLLCGCLPPTDCDDFTISKQGWETFEFAGPGTDQGVYLAGQGWKQADLGIYGLILRIKKNMPQNVQTVTVAFDAPTATAFNINMSGPNGGGQWPVPIGTETIDLFYAPGFGVGEYNFQLFAPNEAGIIVSSFCYAFP